VTQELKVMKVKEAAGSKCLISTLNRSDNALPEAVLNATAPRVSVSLHVFFVFICLSDAHLCAYAIPRSQEQCTSVLFYFILYFLLTIK